MEQNLSKIKTIFSELDIDWVEPHWTTEGAIRRKETGNHAGLYWIMPENNFYFGKATKNNTIIERHKTHWAKLTVDLASLYSTPVEKAQPKWIFPAGWKEGVRKFLIEDPGHIPDHAVKIKKEGKREWHKPGVLHFPVTHTVDIETLPVLLWNLSHLSAEEIGLIEDRVIYRIWPYCNDETYQRRKKGLINE
jgi:hypothetical protein